MKNPVSILAVILAIICVILAIDYLIPNTQHLFTTSTEHIKHAVVFFALTIVFAVAARFSMAKTAEQ